MSQGLAWRGFVILAVVGGSLLGFYPPQETINLGLDLRGGIHLALEVLWDDALRAETDKDMETVQRELREKDGLSAVVGSRVDDNAFELQGVPTSADARISEIASNRLPGWTHRRNGQVVHFERRAEQIAEIQEQSVRQAEQTIRNRVDAFGVAEPSIARQGLGGNRIVVQLPGVDDPERVKELIKNTAFLEFRLVEYPQQGAAGSQEEIVAHYGGTLPPGIEIFPVDQKDLDGAVIGTGYLALEQRQIITGRDLRTARPSIGQFGYPVVSFSLKPEASRTFGETTAANIGRGLAIVLDGRVQSFPTIESRIDSDGQITGTFTQEEVEDLVTVLRSGSLPAGIRYLEDRAVGPALGQDSIDQGLRAGLAGGALVILAMLVIYRRSGINAVLALAFNVVIVFGMLGYFGATLTLPGIAGIVLTIGMAVDANVLIFERIKEELRSGRTVKAAIAAGFAKALSSILDANVTTLIAAVFLFQFGTGPIRGFAVTLSVGILASIFTAVFTSRWIFDLFLARRQRVERLSI